MKLIILLGILSVLTSCGKFNDHIVASSPNPRLKGIDTAFQPYVQNFMDDYRAEFGKNPRLVPVNFYDFTKLGLSKDIVGVCYSYGNKGIEVFINEKYWKYYKPVKRKRLIYHELGHCILNRGHDDSWINTIWGSIKKSFMHSYINGYTYDTNSHEENAYVHELLTKKVDASILP